MVRKRQIRFDDEVYAERDRAVPDRMPERIPTPLASPQASPKPSPRPEIQVEAENNVPETEDNAPEASDNAAVPEFREPERVPSPPASVAGSVVSRAMSAITSVTQLKKPRVRTVILSNDDDNHSRFTKTSRA